MAVTDIDIIWNQVSGTELMLAVREAGYTVRCGAIRGLTSANTTSDSALTDAVARSGKVPLTHPDPTLADLGYVLQHVIARGDSQTTGLVWARYSPPAFSGSPIERLAIEAGSTIEYEQMERLPDTGEPFNVQLPLPTEIDIDPTLDDISTVSSLVTLQTLAVPRATKILSLYGLFGNVPANLEALENCVNSVAWPAATPGTIQMGLGPRGVGHWRASGWSARWSQRDGLYAVAITLASKGKLPGEDWSTYKFSQDPTTGKFLSPEKALMEKLIAQEYEYGPRNNIGGVLKVGLYHLVNFAAILNPILNNTPLRSRTPFNALGI